MAHFQAAGVGGQAQVQRGHSFRIKTTTLYPRTLSGRWRETHAGL